ncbi:NAD-dependent epimerase/dehydratase family protein [Staphylospora marina]|uniref:NAD-dependent epimerase/dehydratase family protein n=1 Tax=Staphylospora marina TaxID=2490858 RepID=UPI000F5BCD10|nr:NAD(P)-dependent oxidoreductase [Staphylospora marina]
MILVTGAAGYIGSKLVASLIEAGIPVRAVDDFSVGCIERIHGHPVLKRNVARLDHVRSVLKDVSVIVHLAAVSDISQCQLNRRQALMTNILSTKYLIDEGVRAGVQKFVFPSSFALYGDPDGIVTEQSPIRPLNFYGHMKSWAEDLLLAEQQKGTLQTVIFRQSNVCGKGFASKNTVLESFCRAALKRQPITIHGSGLQNRNFIHIDDVTDAYMRVISGSGEGVINLAGEESWSIRDLARLVNDHCQEMLGYTVPVIHHERTVIGHEREPSDIRCDISRLKQLLGNRPLRTVHDAIRDYLQP